ISQKQQPSRQTYFVTSSTKDVRPSGTEEGARSAPLLSPMHCRKSRRDGTSLPPPLAYALPQKRRRDGTSLPPSRLCTTAKEEETWQPRPGTIFQSSVAPQSRIHCCANTKWWLWKHLGERF
ncbi:unnamed protein product, partial [Ectocarpus sp. 13 AM-2016]